MQAAIYELVRAYYVAGGHPANELRAHPVLIAFIVDELESEAIAKGFPTCPIIQHRFDAQGSKRYVSTPFAELHLIADHMVTPGTFYLDRNGQYANERTVTGYKTNILTGM